MVSGYTGQKNPLMPGQGLFQKGFRVNLVRAGHKKQQSLGLTVDRLFFKRRRRRQPLGMELFPTQSRQGFFEGSSDTIFGIHFREQKEKAPQDGGIPKNR
jgi:hypothetical protein